jgi:hypothetical protein
MSIKYSPACVNLVTAMSQNKDTTEPFTPHNKYARSWISCDPYVTTYPQIFDEVNSLSIGVMPLHVEAHIQSTH